MTTTLENRGSLPAACVNPREGYKETNLYLLNNGCILQTNNDIPFTEETRLALAWIAYIERCRRIDEIVKKWQSGRKCCRRGKKINKSTRKKKDHINQISQLLQINGFEDASKFLDCKFEL